MCACVCEGGFNFVCLCVLCARYFSRNFRIANKVDEQLRRASHFVWVLVCASKRKEGCGGLEGWHLICNCRQRSHTYTHSVSYIYVHLITIVVAFIERYLLVVVAAQLTHIFANFVV